MLLVSQAEFILKTVCVLGALPSELNLKFPIFFNQNIFQNNFEMPTTIKVLSQRNMMMKYEPHHEKIGFLPKRKQRRRSASQ